MNTMIKLMKRVDVPPVRNGHTSGNFCNAERPPEVAVTYARGSVVWVRAVTNARYLCGLNPPSSLTVGSCGLSSCQSWSNMRNEKVRRLATWSSKKRKKIGDLCLPEAREHRIRLKELRKRPVELERLKHVQRWSLNTFFDPKTRSLACEHFRKYN